MIRKIYLDHQTSIRPFPTSLDRMRAFYAENWSDLESPHPMGQEALLHANQSRVSLYEELGANPDDHFIFTSSASEAIERLFFYIYAEVVRQTGKNHLLISASGGTSAQRALSHLEPLGCAGKQVSLNAQGQVTKEALEEAIKPRTAFCSLPWANGLTGVIQPIADLAQVCKEKEVYLHVDASQVLGKLFFRFQDFPIDFLTFDGSCLHAPRGTGGMFIKAHRQMASLMPHLASLNTAGLIALSHAIERANAYFDHLSTEVVRLRNKFERGIEQGCEGAVILFRGVDRLPHCSAISFPGVASEALLFALHRKGIYASMGGGHEEKLSDVLKACKVEESLTDSALSFSLSYETTEEEIDHALEVIVSCAKKLRSFSLSMRGR